MAKLTKTALRRKTPVTDEVLIPTDDAQAQKFAEAKAAVNAAEQRLSLAQIGNGGIEEAKVNLAEQRVAVEVVREEIRKSGVSITLVGIGRVRWDELLREHPPTTAMKEEDEKLPEHERRPFDPATFWPAALAMTADSDLTADEWQAEVFASKDWGPAELHELRERTKIVNEGSRILELGN